MCNVSCAHIMYIRTQLTRYVYVHSYMTSLPIGIIKQQYHCNNRKYSRE